MKKRIRLQNRFESAFVNYLKLTAMLQDDLAAMLASESSALHWRRNFVRTSVALIEGHAHCLRQMCVVALGCSAQAVSAKERKVILDEGSFDASSRLKLTLRAAYKLFALQPAPSFDSADWGAAQRAVRKRNRLMHPKAFRDLGMADTTWRMHRRGIIWLMEQFFEFLSLSQAKYGN
jgi:hypothetical protein